MYLIASNSKKFIKDCDLNSDDSIPTFLNIVGGDVYNTNEQVTKLLCFLFLTGTGFAVASSSKKYIDDDCDLNVDGDDSEQYGKPQYPLSSVTTVDRQHLYNTVKRWLVAKAWDSWLRGLRFKPH